MMFAGMRTIRAGHNRLGGGKVMAPSNRFGAAPYLPKTRARACPISKDVHVMKIDGGGHVKRKRKGNSDQVNKKRKTPPTRKAVNRVNKSAKGKGHKSTVNNKKARNTKTQSVKRKKSNSKVHPKARVSGGRIKSYRQVPNAKWFDKKG